MKEEDLRQIKEELKLPPQMAETLVQNCMQDGHMKAGRKDSFYRRYVRACAVLMPILFMISVGSTSFAAYQIYQERQLAVFMDSGLTEEEIDAIGEEILKNPAVTSCRFVSGEEAWEEFKDKFFGDNEELAESFLVNPLAESFHYKIKVSFSSDVTAVRRQLLKLDGVRKISTIRDLNALEDFETAVPEETALSARTIL